MSNLVTGLLSLLLATNAFAAATNLVQQAAAESVEASNTNDPVERAYQKILEDDDAAIAQLTAAVESNNAPSTASQGMSLDALRAYREKVVGPVRKEYEEFLREHPDHARAHIAFGSFLDDIHDAEGAKDQYEIAVKLDPNNPAAWNNLANALGDFGPVTNIFIDYTKAIELNPKEPVYYENLATAVFVFRTDARSFYNLTDNQQVFDMSLDLYRKALKLAPDDYSIAYEIGQTYYGITPLRPDDALKAWTNTLNIAKSDLDRQAVYVHIARVNLGAGRLAESHAAIDKVTDPSLRVLKDRILYNLALQDRAAKPPGPPMTVICPSGRAF